MSQENDDIDALHIGNMVGIYSERYGYTVGRIAYRSDDRIRVIPQEASNKVIEFPMTEDGTEFAPDLGVTAIEVIEQQESPYYVDFLGVKPGETVEFFTADGAEAAPSGTVSEVVKTTKRDGIRLEDGRVFSFGGVGPKAPVAVVRVLTENVPAAIDTEPVDAEAAAAAAAAAAARKSRLLEMLRGVLPTKTVEAIPRGERSYPDSMQREDLFQDLLVDIGAKQRTNPRRIRYLEREVDVAVALKNLSVKHDDNGRILGVQPHLVRTVGDALTMNRDPLPIAVPVVSGARVLYLDTADDSVDSKDIVSRSLGDVEEEAEKIAELYRESALPEAFGKGFDAYMMNLLADTGATFEGAAGPEGGWREAQDVIRTAGYTTPVQGLSMNLPAFSRDKDDESAVSLSFLVKNVMDRSMRLLPAAVRVNARSQDEVILAPSDPATITQYVIMPTKAALTLRPPKRPGDLPTALLYSAALESANLPTVVKTIRDLYTTDAKSPMHVWDLESEAAADYDIADWLASVLRYTVHPAESLAPRTPALLSVLDAVGAGQHDMSPAVAAIISSYVNQSQQTWLELLAAKSTDTQAAIDAVAPRTFQSVTGADAPLWPALMAADPLAEFFADLQQRNPTIGQAPTLITAALLHEAQGDAAPLVWATIGLMDNRTTDIDPVAAATTLATSRAAAQRRRILRDSRLAALKAAPEINTCPHVAVLEAVRNVSDVLTRSRMLREFIETYQGGREGDWMTCVLCRKPCVCYHELMELEALAQPARMDAIQRQILVQFGGDRYEGKIVCRNCGQALQDIEYDEHVEFDDEGNPIVSSSVLTEEQRADPGESAWRKTVQALAPPELEFATQAQNEIHRMLREILTRGNILVDSAIVRTIVEQADIYVKARSPSRTDYETKRAAEMKKAGGKVLPEFGAFVNILRIAVVGALISIWMQIAHPPIAVNNPSPYCGSRFRREGWPLKTDANPMESGPFRYVCCVIANIARKEAPWSDFTWQKESKIETRITQVLKSVLGAADIIVSKSAMPFSTQILTRLAEVRSDADQQRAQELVSHTDQLPAGFRPEPFPASVQRPVLEKDPVGTLRDAIASNAPIAPMVAPIVAALHEQARAVIHELHEDAAATVQNDVCCPTAITDVQSGKLQGAPESAGLLAARVLLHDHMPTSANAGTHLWSAFTPMAPVAVAQEVDPGVFFKLFLKFCYRGPAVGEAHEFSVGNICRQCGLVLGKPIDLIDVGTEGAAILAAQQGDLKVEASTAAFEALSTAVRRRRILEPRTVGGVIPWREGLEIIARFARASYKQSMLPVSTAVEAVLANITGHEDEPASALDRSAYWEPLTELHDRLRDAILARLQRGPTAKYATRAIANLEMITADPFVEGPAAVQEYWCSMSQAAGQAYQIESVNGARWFKLSRDHNERINAIIRENMSWYGADITPSMRQVLRQLGIVLGPLIRLWIRHVRPGISGGVWDIKDAQMLLRTLVYQVWHDTIHPSSWMYARIEATNADATAIDLVEWTTTLMIHSGRQFVKYSDEQIRTMLQKRAELERTSIVQEFDRISDPDERAAALLLKQFRIGRWARGQNIQSLDADTYDFETEQRHRMGIVDPPVDPLLLREGQGPQRETYGLGGLSGGGAEDGYAVDQGEAGAND